MFQIVLQVEDTFWLDGEGAAWKDELEILIG